MWLVDDAAVIGKLEEEFGKVPDFYIADGHHRAASAVKVGIKRRENHLDYTGEEEFNYFLAVLFPSSELSIWDYNRVVADLNGLGEEEFLKRVEEAFTVEPVESEEKPAEKHTMGMYLNHRWYLSLIHI